MRARHTATGLALGYLADRVVGDPSRCHPVAALGRALSTAERRLYRDSRAAGLAYAAMCIGGAGVAAVAARGLTARYAGGPGRVALTAAATWSALGGTTLTRVGQDVAVALDDGDIAAARAWVPSLCGRDPAALDAAGICRAAVESIAENTSDATVGPLVWGAVAGVPGLVVYRTVNTLDAMVGYRSDRYVRFGWASARLDDLMNLLPARLTGVLTVLLGPDRRRATRAWRRDARQHPSPNAGVVEAAFAGALGLRLGGETVYPHGTELRPVLGDGREPGVNDLRAAVALSRRVQVGAVAVGVLVVGARGVIPDRVGISRRIGR
ncbi:cobalamin biosynthesis protein [Gordonia sinesedis]